jgi:adenylate kinase
MQFMADVAQFSTGDYFQAALSRHRGSSTERNQIRETDWTVLEDEVSECIISDYRALPPNTCYLLETHFAASSPFGYMMGLGVKCLERIAEAFFPDLSVCSNHLLVAIILIEADIVDLIKRRRADVIRHREMSVLDIIRNLELSRVFSLEYYNAFARYLGYSRVQYLRVTNADVEKCSHRICCYLQDWQFLQRDVLE